MHFRRFYVEMNSHYFALHLHSDVRTNSMHHSPTLEVNSPLDEQEICHFCTPQKIYVCPQNFSLALRLNVIYV
jgi:hypothetical protein